MYGDGNNASFELPPWVCLPSAKSFNSKETRHWHGRFPYPLPGVSYQLALIHHHHHTSRPRGLSQLPSLYLPEGAP